jgi:hypothetical protein
MLLALTIIFAHTALAILLSWGYFRRYTLQRPPIGVFNLWDIAVMLAGIVLVPYLYLILPRWLVAGLLALGLLSIIYFMLEPILRTRWMIWLTVVLCLGAELGAVWGFGGRSAPFFAINNILQVLTVVGVTVLWAQSGLKARDAAVLGGFLVVYDFIFTSVLTFMIDLINRLAGLPFAPIVTWPASRDGQWLGIGLGDLLLAAVFPLVMRKAYGRSAGLAAMFITLVALGGLMLPPLSGLLTEPFPVMVLLGPLMIFQYLYWRKQRGAERTTWQYLQAEPRSKLARDGRIDLGSLSL